MKKLILFGAFLIMGTSINAQSATSEALAKKIALKVRDTLGLSSGDADRIYGANMQIAREKETLWSDFRSSPDLRAYLQKAENKRDSLYKIILSADRYVKYLRKKSVLISSN